MPGDAATAAAGDVATAGAAATPRQGAHVAQPLVESVRTLEYPVSKSSWIGFYWD